MDALTVLPSNFGYVIFTYLYSWIMLGYLAVKVGGGRKKYNVKVSEKLILHALKWFLLASRAYVRHACCLFCSIPPCTATKSKSLTASRERIRTPWKCTLSGWFSRPSQLLFTRYVLSYTLNQSSVLSFLFYAFIVLVLVQWVRGRAGTRPRDLWHEFSR